MSRVIITGWQPGLKKVSLSKLIRDRSGLRLSEAKACTDRCLDGEIVSIDLASADEAEQFAQEAARLGAIVQVVPDPDHVPPRVTT
jgi:ribosomal protein L7/L12